MRSSRPGKGISASVENITPLGVWLIFNEKEFFLNYRDFPCFKNQTSKSIHHVEVLHGRHLYWPELDVDLEVDNLENPEKYPLKSTGKPLQPNHSNRSASERR
jgi:hypothetical protein